MPVRGTQSHTAFLEWQEMLSRLGFSPSRIEPRKDTKILCAMTKTNRRMRTVSLTSTRIKGKNPEWVEGWGSGSRQVGFISWLCHILAMWPWVSYIPLLCLSSLTWINGCDSGTHHSREKRNELLYVKPLVRYLAGRYPEPLIICERPESGCQHILFPSYEPLKVTDKGRESFLAKLALLP